jgi:drug/metabolite transporter (DMT)-like permease
MGPARTSIRVYTMPIWAGLFARVMRGERLTRNRIAALLLGAGSVAVLVSQDLTHVRDAPLGAALTLVAAMSFGLGTVWLKRRAWPVDSSVIAFWQLAIGLVPLLVVWAAFSAPPDLSRAGPAQWAALGFLGVIASGAAYFAWFRIVGLLPASISGISSLVMPCTGRCRALGWRTSGFTRRSSPRLG